MLEALAPKITDISSIKGISALLALPMLCVAYFLQTGAAIAWDDSIWLGIEQNIETDAELQRLILIFVLKSIWASFFGVIGYGALSFVQISIDFPVIRLTSVLFIAFALFGIFCSQLYTPLRLITPFWFYGLIVWGIFLSSMQEQLDAERSKIEANRQKYAR